jgi:hypothetical protein
MFRQRGMAFHPAMSNVDWETLFLLQHSGGPTRLLDWTENPFIALYFALTDSERNAPTGEPATVWVMNPISWNRGALAHMSFDGGILSVGDDPLSGYAPSADSRLMNTEPVNLFSIHNSPRVVAQRGVFTVFGKSSEPMEERHKSLPFPSTALARIDIPEDKTIGMLKSLRAIGFSESAIFPDLDGLAKEIRRENGL